MSYRDPDPVVVTGAMVISVLGLAAIGLMTIWLIITGWFSL